MVAVKALVVGGPSEESSASQLLTKISTINSKNGPFDIALVVGDFFPKEFSIEDVKAVLDGSIKSSVPTFFSVGNHDFPEPVKDKLSANDGELAENLTFLGKQGIYSTSNGLKIAFFGGKFSLDHFTDPTYDSPDSMSPYFTENSVNSFLSTLEKSTSSTSAKTPAKGIDILLTHALPTQIDKYSSREFKPSSDTTLDSITVPALSDILKNARPRYHFTDQAAVFWEREPFLWPSSQQSSRFISLGHFGNPSKQRWFYAFNLNVGETDPVPSNATQCPLDQPSSTSKRPATDVDYGQANFIFQEKENKKQRSNKFNKDGQSNGNAQGGKPPPDNYVCRICNEPGHWIQQCPQKQTQEQKHQNRNNQQPPKNIQPEECWFCLSNPNITKHLIVDIGSETYVTLPKGQLPNPDSSPVPGGGHVLIIPIAHYPSLASLSPEDKPAVLGEIEKYKDALTKCYAKYDASLVAFETVRLGKGSVHANIQICPIPNSFASNLEGAFSQAAKEAGYALEEGTNDLAPPEPKESSLPGTGYVKIYLPGDKSLVHHILPGKSFNLQFCRTVLANFLGTPERQDWRQAVAASDDEEKKECSDFREAFEQFKPNLE